MVGREQVRCHGADDGKNDSAACRKALGGRVGPARELREGVVREQLHRAHKAPGVVCAGCGGRGEKPGNAPASRTENAALDAGIVGPGGAGTLDIGGALGIDPARGSVDLPGGTGGHLKPARLCARVGCRAKESETAARREIRGKPKASLAKRAKRALGRRDENTLIVERARDGARQVAAAGHQKTAIVIAKRIKTRRIELVLEHASSFHHGIAIHEAVHRRSAARRRRGCVRQCVSGYPGAVRAGALGDTGTKTAAKA